MAKVRTMVEPKSRAICASLVFQMRDVLRFVRNSVLHRDVPSQENGFTWCRRELPGACPKTIGWGRCMPVGKALDIHFALRLRSLAFVHSLRDVLFQVPPGDIQTLRERDVTIAGVLRLSTCSGNANVFMVWAWMLW